MRLHRRKRLCPPFGRKIVRIDHGKPCLFGKGIRCRPTEEKRVAMFHDLARGLHRIADAPHESDRASLQGPAVHDRSVKLMPAFGIECGAVSGIEVRTVLHDDHGRFDRIER